MNIHFIAIGGAVMHNLAIALHLKGYHISGSDDELLDPSKSRLEKYGLLPEKWGWFEENITPNLDAVILGMHARPNNPELKRALELNLKIFSFPEYLYEQTKNKKRVVIAGSHGKTTITSMVMHALRKQNVKFDYMVGSQLEGFDTMVGLSKEADIAIFEGDEYLSSPLDKRPKFHHYKPFITLISGIAWDHMNVYPDYEEYKEQFFNLGMATAAKGKIFYCESDNELVKISQNWTAEKQKGQSMAKAESYRAFDYKIKENHTEIHYREKLYPTHLIGRYNMENLNGAMQICISLGIEPDAFLLSMKDFKGAARRQELVFEKKDLKIYRDFAHAPSKVKATVSGFREQFVNQRLTALLELHTFSSLNKSFLPQYKGAMKEADKAIVFYNPEVVKHKNLPPLDKNYIRECFSQKNLIVIDDPASLKEEILKSLKSPNILLIMSSGNVGGIKAEEIAKEM